MTLLRPACLVLIGVLYLSSGIVDAKKYSSGLRDDYYHKSCPNAESIITKVVIANVTDPSNPLALGGASGILRLAFHDCFVEGCDGSVLLDGNDTEKTAPANKFLRGFEILDAAKAELEAVCPGVVSCADIVQYAARDSVVALNGSSWKVQGGRKDGRVSKAARAESELPSADLTVTGLTASFKRRGLSRDQMVILSGSHTSAAGHCENLVKRLYNFSKKHATDPSIPPAYEAQLKATCPQNTFNDSAFLIMDVVSPFFDSGYYETLKQHKGVFTSDQTLYDDRRTRPLVNTLTNNGLFLTKFGEAMRAMGAVDVKRHGEIRKDCRSVNTLYY